MDEEKLEARALKTLNALEIEDAEVSIWICDDETIRQLHNQYFGKDSATNVISFAQQEGEFDDGEEEMLGDVVISYETAGRDAAEVGAALDSEVAYLFIHGLLHLIGYDHEGDRAARSIQDHMHIIEALERRDADLAERLVRQHTPNLADHVEAHVDWLD